MENNKSMLQRAMEYVAQTEVKEEDILKTRAFAGLILDIANKNGQNVVFEADEYIIKNFILDPEDTQKYLDLKITIAFPGLKYPISLVFRKEDGIIKDVKGYIKASNKNNISIVNKCEKLLFSNDGVFLDGFINSLKLILTEQEFEKCLSDNTIDNIIEKMVAFYNAGLSTSAENFNKYVLPDNDKSLELNWRNDFINPAKKKYYDTGYRINSMSNVSYIILEERGNRLVGNTIHVSFNYRLFTEDQYRNLVNENKIPEIDGVEHEYTNSEDNVMFLIEFLNCMIRLRPDNDKVVVDNGPVANIVDKFISLYNSINTISMGDKSHPYDNIECPETGRTFAKFKEKWDSVLNGIHHSTTKSNEEIWKNKTVYGTGIAIDFGHKCAELCIVNDPDEYPSVIFVNKDKDIDVKCANEKEIYDVKDMTSEFTVYAGCRFYEILKTHKDAIHMLDDIDTTVEKLKMSFEATLRLESLPRTSAQTQSSKSVETYRTNIMLTINNKIYYLYLNCDIENLYITPVLSDHQMVFSKSVLDTINMVIDTDVNEDFADAMALRINYVIDAINKTKHVNFTDDSKSLTNKIIELIKEYKE